MKRPFQLKPIFRERVWGRENLAPWFDKAWFDKASSDNALAGRIGEVWFSCEENPTSLGIPLGELLAQHPEILGTAANPAHPGTCPLLVKLLFTSERLSVQVHPGDDYARRYHNSLGKTEAWYVLDAQPPGEVAVGFREQISRERMSDAARTGEIEQLLDWRKVSPDDVIFVPAGTVHAIGAGLTICEIQENSDITYRLYDYGRPRELHLEHGAAVSHLGCHDPELKRRKLSAGREELLACDYFRIERITPPGALSIEAGLPHYLLMICVKGAAHIAGEPVQAGQAWMIPAHSDAVRITPMQASSGAEWIVTYTAPEPAAIITS